MLPSVMHALPSGGSGKDYFTIKNGTRELYVTRALDREVEDSYDLVVEVSYKIGFERSGFATGSLFSPAPDALSNQ